MKKTALIVLVVAVLIGLTYWADRKWPAGGKPTVKAADSATSPADVTMKDLQGNEVTLAQLKGKVVLVNFWATWCQPCQIEIPWLIEFQQKYGPRGLTILGVAMDDEGKSVVEPFVQKQRFDVNGQQEAVNYPIVLGSDTVADKLGGIIGLPTSMLFSRDGKKIKTIVGLINHDDLEKAIQSLL